MTDSQPLIVLAGSVRSSARTLEGLIRNRAPLAGVLGLNPRLASGVSGFTDLAEIAAREELPFRHFDTINSPEVIEALKNWKPDLILFVGLSQIVREEVLSIPAIGSVGYHPTLLPEGRGRAPLAWLALEANRRPWGASTFFRLDGHGVDAGPILVQEQYSVEETDYASDIERKALEAIDRGIDKLVPELISGKWQGQLQDESKATHYAKRGPDDGRIDWSQPATEILALVRAAGRPHPGAYCYIGRHKLAVWRAELENERRLTGVTGAICEEANGDFLVQTGEGLLWLKEVEWLEPLDATSRPSLRTGRKLGYDTEDEVFRLREKVHQMECRLAELEQGRGKGHR